MNSLLEKVRRFIQSLSGESGELPEESSCRNLPLFVSASYDFCKLQLFGRACLVAMLKAGKQLTPEQIIAQNAVLQKSTAGSVLFVFPSGSGEFCSSLIKAGIPFAIPGRQIFFPENIVAIRKDKFNAPVTKKRDFLSPWAQVILLYHLLNKQHRDALPYQYLQTQLKAKKVYISRSAAELVQAGIAEIVSNRRLKSLVFVHDRRSIWEKMQDKFSSPVIKRIRLENPPADAVYAGFSALSQYSLLADDVNPTFALYGRGVKFDRDDLREFSGVHLELWKYDPLLLSKDGKLADKLSLYLSLKDNPDPRVGGELQKMMEQFEW